MLRKWRIRAYEDDYEIMADRTLMLALDLESASGLACAQSDLESMRVMVSMRTSCPLARVRLAVCDASTDAIALDWLGRAA